jgi:hypothetical protein
LESVERIDHVAYFGRAHRTVGAIVQIIVHDDLDDVSQIPLHQLCVRMSELDLREHRLKAARRHYEENYGEKK